MLIFSVCWGFFALETGGDGGVAEGEACLMLTEPWKIVETEAGVSFEVGIRLTIPDTAGMIGTILGIRLPDGWVMERAVGAEGLTVTRTEAWILFDGSPPGGEEAVMLTLSVWVPAGADRDGEMAVFPCPADPFLYIHTGEGAVCRLCLTEARRDICLPSAETETETEKIPDPGVDEGGGWLYLGCQEARAADGRMYVRFLFAVGEDGACGAVLPVGGGVTVCTVTYSDRVTVWNGSATEERMPLFLSGGRKRICMLTFSGLDADRVYTFFIDTGEGMYKVRYERGDYCEETLRKQANPETGQGHIMQKTESVFVQTAESQHNYCF